MIENDKYKTEMMLSDIRDNSLTGMMKSRGKERLSIVSVLYGIVAFLFLLFVYPILTSIMNLNSFIGKTLLYILIVGVGYYITVEEFVLERRKKDKRKVEMISKGGDMIGYFMKIKDLVRKDYDLPYRVTVVEGMGHHIIPIEVTYHNYEDYAQLIDGIAREGLGFQEFELRGRITLFDKYRMLYRRFEGTTLIKFAESIYRENEKIYMTSTSRRLYVLLYVTHSKDLLDTLSTVIASSYCKLQFLSEKMYKEMAEYYFHCPVNLEKMKARNVIRKISLEDTKIIGKFNSEEELSKFLETYRDTRYKHTFKFKIRRDVK